MRSAIVVLALLVGVARADEQDNCVNLRQRAKALAEVLATIHDATAEYRAMMQSRIAEAKKQADACDRRQSASRQAEAEREAADRDAAEQAAKKAATDKLVMDQLKSEPSFIRLVWSSYLCTFEAELAAAQHRLATLESTGGTNDETVLDPFARANASETIRQAEATIARAKTVLKRGKLVPVSCKQKDVAAFAGCMMDPSKDPRCATEQVALAIRAQAEIIASGQTTASPAPLALQPRSAAPANGELPSKSPADENDIYTPNF